MSDVARLTLQGAKTSHWNVAGVTLGSTLAEVQRINGKPILISEAETDFDGFVVGCNGGTLSRELPGGDCGITLRFGRNDHSYAPISGERISSDNPKLVKWRPVVTQIQVNFLKK